MTESWSVHRNSS